MAVFVTSRAHGLDISKYDVSFNPAKIINQLDFVIQRISYGLMRDEKFDTLSPAVMQVPIRGAYHYLSSNIDYKSQVDKFLGFIDSTQYHFFNCDFEGAYNKLSVGFAKIAWDWIHYVEQKTGKATLLYTSPSIYKDYILPSQQKYGIDWSTVPLWIAQYYFIINPNSNPSVNPWKVYQYTAKGKGSLYGIGVANCDLDVYNGTVDEMKTWLGLEGTTPPLPIPVPQKPPLKLKLSRGELILLDEEIIENE